MTKRKKFTVIQTLPALDVGGVERGTVEIARALVDRGHRSIVVSAGGRLVNELIDTGSDHILLPIGKKSPATLRFIPQLRRLLLENNVAILHSRSRFPAWISYLAWKGLSSISRPRFITSVHGPYSVNRYSRIMMSGEKIIAISNFIQKYILDNYPNVSEENICMIPRGISTKNFPFAYYPDEAWISQWEMQFPETKGKRLITIPARLTRWKGQEDFLKIFSLLINRKNIHGLVAGGPHSGKESYCRELKEKAHHMGLDGLITFTGHRNDIREIMSISSIVLSLSTKPEAFGRTVLESLALGIPVIAFDHGGAGEILRSIFPDGLTPVKNHKITAERILSFLETPPSVKNQNPYTLERMQKETIDLYESLAFAHVSDKH